MTDLPYLTATEALARFRARELSPVELMTAVIERAGAVEPVINAFAATRYDEALEAARAAEARYAGSGPPPRPLEGLPVAVKEEAPIAGQLNTLGSLPLRDVSPTTPPRSRSGSWTRAASCTPGPPPRSSAARRSPGRSCGA